MKQRTWLVLFVGAALVLVLSALQLETRAPEVSVSHGEPKAAPPPPAAAPKTASATRPQRGLAKLQPRGKPHVDPEKVRAALARLNELQDSITQQELDSERALMEAKAKEFAAIETPEPKHTSVTISGRRWDRLEFPSGEVRYEFPMD